MCVIVYYKGYVLPSKVSHSFEIYKISTLLCCHIAGVQHVVHTCL